MIDIDKWQEIFASMRRYKARTFMTAFGVFWGIFMLVALLGAGKGLENGAVAGFGHLKNAVFVYTDSPTSLPYQGLSRGRVIKFQDEDVAAIRQNIAEVDILVVGNEAGSQFVQHGDSNSAFSVSGAQPALLRLRSQRLLLGRYINQFDLEQRRKVAVIGTRVREILFGPEIDPVGQSIEIRGMFFRVVGVFDVIGSSGGFDQRAAETIYIPNSTLRYTFNQADRISQIIVTPHPGFRAEAIEKQVDALLRQRHRVHPDDPAPIGTFNVQERFEEVEALFSGITVFSWLVATGTIIAGVIGVGNIMLIVVNDRTVEIGIRKSVGATPLSIVAMIIQESLLITGVAGYFGLVVGVFLLEGVGAVLEQATGGEGFFVNPEIDFNTALIAMSVLMFAGALAALLPASRAAQIDPVLALRDQ
jgi:putative ABC transport system permease protein